MTAATPKPIPKRSDKVLLAMIDDEDVSETDSAYAARVLIDRGFLTGKILRASTPGHCEHGRSVWSSCARCDDKSKPIARWIKRYGAICKAIFDELRAEFDDECSDRANYDHLLHMFEGYREYATFGDEATCPYHPGGARAFSWDEGVKAAKRDKARELPPPAQPGEDDEDEED